MLFLSILIGLTTSFTSPVDAFAAIQCASAFRQLDHSDPNYDALFGEELLKAKSTIYNHALRLTKNKQDAEDLASETFRRAWQAKNDYKTDKKILAWLLRICSNLYLDLLRHRSRRPDEHAVSQIERFNGQGEPINLLDHFSDDQSNTHDVPTDLAPLLLDLFIRATDDTHGAVLYYSYVVGLSMEDIAAIMSTKEEIVPPGTVRSRIFRAKKQLKDSITAGRVSLPTPEMNDYFLRLASGTPEA